MKATTKQTVSQTEPETVDGAQLTPPKTEIKSVKHTFSQEERNQFGADLARTIGGLRGIEAEFDQVKAGFKARTTEAEARIDKLSTDLMNGFEFRQKNCVVIFRPEDKKKDFLLLEDFEDVGSAARPALTEVMTSGDFQTDLIVAESKFSHRCEIALFTKTRSDHGLMIIGEFKGLWFAALRVSVGQHKLDERLDSEQSCAKKRQDIIRRTAARFEAWTLDRLGKDAAKGFAEPLSKAVESQKERVE